MGLNAEHFGGQDGESYLTASNKRHWETRNDHFQSPPCIWMHLSSYSVEKNLHWPLTMVTVKHLHGSVNCNGSAHNWVWQELIVCSYTKDSGYLETFFHAWSSQDVGKHGRIERAIAGDECVFRSLTTLHSQGHHTSFRRLRQCSVSFSIKGQTECFGTILAPDLVVGKQLREYRP